MISAYENLARATSQVRRQLPSEPVPSVGVEPRQGPPGHLMEALAGAPPHQPSVAPATGEFQGPRSREGLHGSGWAGSGPGNGSNRGTLWPLRSQGQGPCTHPSCLCTTRRGIQNRRLTQPPPRPAAANLDAYEAHSSRAFRDPLRRRGARAVIPQPAKTGSPTAEACVS